MTETDVLNQEQIETNDIPNNDPSDDDEDLFGDYVPEESDKPTDDEGTNQDVDDETDDEEGSDTATDTDTDSQVAGSQNQPSFMEVKYMKETRNLTKEEAIEFAQKGMDYDRVKERYESVKASEGHLNELSRLAQANGMSVDEYMKNLSDVQDTFELNREVEALKAQYPNSDDALLEELARTHLVNNANLVSKKKEIEDAKRRQEASNQLARFEKRYPNVDVQTVAQNKEIISLMAQGCTLLEAYDEVMEKQRLADEKQKESLEKIKQQNLENKKRSLGKTSNNGYEGQDEFLKELFSD